MKFPRLCTACGGIHPVAERCRQQIERERARKERFDRTRPSSRDRGYDHEWEKARRVYLAAHPYCAMCGMPASIVDHIVPHKGDKRLFWDRANWQSLCVRHHSSTKQRLERQAVQP